MRPIKILVMVTCPSCSPRARGASSDSRIHEIPFLAPSGPSLNGSSRQTSSKAVIGAPGRSARGISPLSRSVPSGRGLKLPTSLMPISFRESNSRVKITLTVKTISGYSTKNVDGNNRWAQGNQRGISLGFSSILVPAIAQSMSPDFLSIRKSRNHSPTESTIVSVVSSGTSGTHRSEMRVEKPHDEPSWAPVADMVWRSLPRWFLMFTSSFITKIITTSRSGRFRWSKPIESRSYQICVFRCPYILVPRVCPSLCNTSELGNLKRFEDWCALSDVMITHNMILVTISFKNSILSYYRSIRTLIIASMWHGRSDQKIDRALSKRNTEDEERKRKKGARKRGLSEPLVG